MNGFTNPPKKRNLSAAERKRLRKQQRRNAVIGTTLAVAASTFTPETQPVRLKVGDPIPLSFQFILPPEEVRVVVGVGAADLVVMPDDITVPEFNDLLPQPTIPRDRSVSIRADEHRARVATLERVLLDDLERSHRAAKEDVLHGFALRLKQMAWHPRAEEALQTFILGKEYMMSLSDRLAVESREDLDPAKDGDYPGIEPFRLYEPSPDGMGIQPAPEAIEAWETMRNRMLRGKSDLGKKWLSSGVWAWERA